MILYDIKDEDALLRDVQESKLSILIGMDSFSYIIQHPERGLHRFRFVQVDEAKGDNIQKLDYALRGEAALQRQFQEVRVAFLTHLFTAVPDRLYKLGENRAYLEHIGPLQDDDLALTDDLMPVKAHQIYQVPERLIQVLQQILPPHRQRHWSTLFINHFGNQHFSGSGHQLYLYILGNKLHVVLFREGELEFQNAFSFQSSKDCLYYTMLVYDQFGLTPDKSVVHLCGQIMTDSDIYRLLDRFLPHIPTMPLPGHFKLAKALLKFPPYFYVDHALNLL